MLCSWPPWQEAVDYVGTNFSGEGAAAPPCQYAVALVDEAAGTVSFVPVAGGRVLRLDATVRGMDYGPPPWTADEAEDTPAGRAAARRRLDDSALPLTPRAPAAVRSHLTRPARAAFATEKRRRQQARLQTARTVAPEALPAMDDMQAFMRTAVKDEATAAELARRVAAVRNIPPHDPAAACAAAAYPLDKVFPRHLVDLLNWRELLKASKSSKARATLEESEVPPPAYVLNRLSRVAEPTGGEGAAKALALLAPLLRLFAAPNSVDDEWLREHLPLPPAVLPELLRRFTESAAEAPAGRGATPQPPRKARYSRPKPKVDLLRAYILVLALHVDNFSLDWSDLAVELRVDKAALIKPIMELGCKIKGSGSNPRCAALMPDAADGQTLTTFLPDTTTRPSQAKRR